MNRGRQFAGASSGFSCCGKARSGCVGIRWARAAAPPPSSSQYSSANETMFRSQTTKPTSSSLLAESVSSPPWMRSLDQLHGRPQRAEHEDADEQDREHAKPVRADVDLARVAQHDADEQHAGDHRQQKLRPGPQLVGQELGQDHRDHDRDGHRPARLADDDLVVASGSARTSGRVAATTRS